MGGGRVRWKTGPTKARISGLNAEARRAQRNAEDWKRKLTEK
jgi:hypothetical protein